MFFSELAGGAVLRGKVGLRAWPSSARASSTRCSWPPRVYLCEAPVGAWRRTHQTKISAAPSVFCLRPAWVRVAYRRLRVRRRARGCDWSPVLVAMRNTRGMPYRLINRMVFSRALSGA